MSNPNFALLNLSYVVNSLLLYEYKVNIIS